MHSPSFERLDHDGRRVLAAGGDIDLACRDEFRGYLAVLIADPPSPSFVDLSDVTFLDSIGVGVLVGAQAIATNTGGRLIVVAPSVRCREALELSGLDEVIDVGDALTVTGEVASY